MSEKHHGRRYLFPEKKEILKYLEKHTYKDTSEKYRISEPTLARWRNMIKSESKKNKVKLVISLPKFWLEYLNEQIESDVWEDYSDAILNVIRYYFKGFSFNKFNLLNFSRASSNLFKVQKPLVCKLISHSMHSLCKVLTLTSKCCASQV